MPAIYRPSGAALEYSPLACNLYRGCGHGCRYCYAPACLRMSALDFHGAPTPRPGVLEQLRRDAVRLPAGSGPVLLCFSCDPYQPIEADHHLTRQAIEILGVANMPIRLLTKNPALALRDLDVMVRYRVDFGVSLVWMNDARRREWEPAAGTVADRLSALVQARAAGLQTWVSIEPVVDPAEALLVIRSISGSVDAIKVGKLNHDPARERKVDWPSFTRQAIALMQAVGQTYYIKRDLWRACAGKVEGFQSWPV
jgi:DNA repair photolyase